MSLGITLVLGGVGLATVAWLKGHADALPKEYVEGGSFFASFEAAKKDVQRNEDMGLRAAQRAEDVLRQRRERVEDLKLRTRQRGEDKALAAEQRKQDLDLRAAQRTEDRDRAETWRVDDRDLREREKDAMEFLHKFVGTTLHVTRWHETEQLDGNGDPILDGHDNPEMHRVAGVLTGDVKSVGSAMLSLIEHQMMGGHLIDSVLHRIPLGDIIKVQSA